MTTRCDAVLIVDDHPLVAESVAGLVLSISPNCLVERRDSLRSCGVLANRGSRFDVVVIDLTLPDASGLEALSQLKSWWPAAYTIVFSGARNTLLQRHCQSAGAHEFVLKTASTGELRAALLRALGRAAEATPQRAVAAPARSVRVSAYGLPPKQEAIWRDLASGLSNQEIAERHGISINTVKTHVREVFERIGARNRTEAARVYVSASADQR